MSDGVDNAVIRNLLITKNPAFLNNDWRDFEKAIINKKVIIYGINVLLNFLSMRCEKKFSIVAAIDNNSEKQNLKLGDLYDEGSVEGAEEIIISPREKLNEYDPNEIVVLISSYKYYDEIADELDSKGFHHYYSILNLEYNYREKMKKNDLKYEDRNEHLEKYVKECSEKYPIQKNKVVVSMGTYIDNGKWITNALLALKADVDIGS